MKGIGDIGKVLKQAQKLQSEMAIIQEEVAKKTVEVSVGGGMVNVIVNGKQELVSITIDPEVMGDAEMLQDMIIAAVNKGINDSQELVKSAFSGVTGNLGIPGLF